MAELTSETLTRGLLRPFRARLACEMSTRVALLLVSAWLWWSPAVYADDRPAGVPESARWAKVDRVSDGDTIVLMDRTRIRLHGIDAPERDQPYGDIATAALKYMVGRSVYYVGPTRIVAVMVATSIL